MNTWNETVIYYKGKLNKKPEMLLKAYRFAVEVMSYTTEYGTTDIGIDAKDWIPKYLSIKENGIKFEKYLKKNNKNKEIDGFNDFNVFSRISDDDMTYECVQFHYRIEDNYLMFSFNSEIAEELELERIAFIMKEMMLEITEGEIFECESKREISGYITGMYGDEELEWKEVLYDLINDFKNIEKEVNGRDRNWGNISISELIESDI